MSKSTAELLKLKRGKADKTGGIGGTTEGHWSKFSFKIKAGREEHTFNNVDVFVLNIDLDVPILIGRAGFFERFEVSFIENKKIKLKRKSLRAY